MVQTAALALFFVLFFFVCRGAAPRPAPRALAVPEVLPAETFLALDVLAGLSAAIAARAWTACLIGTGAVLLAGLVFPRGFCGYVCPLGTMIDVFDWAVGRRPRPGARGQGTRRLAPEARAGGPPIRPRRWWVHLRYHLLIVVLAAAAMGGMLSGFVAALPVLTRGMQSLVAALQRVPPGGRQIAPPLGAGQAVSVALLGLALALGLLGARFWCRCLCPTGAALSLAGRLALTRRQVGRTCIACGRCADACPFDAIQPDFTTRQGDCTFCQTCGGVCPVGAIQFVGRWHKLDLRPAESSPAGPAGRLSRRRFLAGAAVGVAGGVGLGNVLGAPGRLASAAPAVRPPGSLPEEKFLALCIRCGSCLKACPTGVLQPVGFEGGLRGLWTPRADADGSGCDPACNACGQVCPTGAIRPLPLEEKRCARMGLAVINEPTCLPHAGRTDCQLCLEACAKAGYGAIEFLRVGVELDESGLPLEDSGRLAPAVLPDRCVGCGLCQARCCGVNVRDRHLLAAPAIVVAAGPGKEDRLASGSYRALREEERRRQQEHRPQPPATLPGQGDYLPDFLR